MNHSLAINCTSLSVVGHLSVTSYVIATTILSITTVLATPGNVLVIWVITKTPFLRAKAVNMLIVNLCLIDLVASCFDTPLMSVILQLNYYCWASARSVCSW